MSTVQPYLPVLSTWCACAGRHKYMPPGRAVEADSTHPAYEGAHENSSQAHVALASAYVRDLC